MHKNHNSVFSIFGVIALCKFLPLIFVRTFPFRLTGFFLICLFFYLHFKLLFRCCVRKSPIGRGSCAWQALVFLLLWYRVKWIYKVFRLVQGRLLLFGRLHKSQYELLPFGALCNLIAEMHNIKILVIVLTGHVLWRLDLSNMMHHHPLVRGKYYALISSAQWSKNGYFHLH